MAKAVAVGARVYIVNHTHKKVVGCKADGTTYTTPNRDLWEEFEVQEAKGGKIILHNATHKLNLGAKEDKSMKDDKVIYAHKNNAEWEQWTVVHDAKLNGWHLQSHHKQNLGCNAEGKLYMHSNKAEWETWQLVPALPAGVALD